jgi:hypothetical protein
VVSFFLSLTTYHSALTTYRKIMSRNLFLLFILLVLTAQIAFAQTIKTDNKDEELKKEALVFLRETAVDVGNLRTLENRISFSAEIANLMWFQDEREAQTLFQKVINDFRQLMTQIDAQYTAQANAPKEEDGLFDDSSTSDRKLQRKFGKAISVRQQIALSIAEHDPQMAYDFFTGTAQVVTNPQLLAQIADSDQYFELKLIFALADKDADKALEGGRKRLAKGFSFELIDLLRKIYNKDADKGITFGEEIVAKVKTENSKSINLYLLNSLLGAGEENLEKIKSKPGKKPMLSEQSMREIADLMAQEIMKRDEKDVAEVTSYIPRVEKYSPSRGVLIRQKFKIPNTDRKNTDNKREVYTIATVENDAMVMPSSVKSESSENQEAIFRDTLSLGNTKLSKEEREKLIKESREKITKIKSREQKLIALSFLAGQISLAGDKELASEIMNEARGLVNLQPKNYRDFLLVWMLASGYAMADADKAFPLLEDAISRLNETISAFIKIGEFIDVDEEIIEGDEVQLGSFGGSMTREMLGALGASNPMLRGLAAADFARTKALTNRFDRLEVRILAKMLVLRAVLGDKKVVAEN